MSILHHKTFLPSLVGSFIAFLAFIPSLYGFLNAPSQGYYTTLQGEDEYSRLTWLYQSMQGHLTFRSTQILEPHGWVQFQPFYLLAGRVAWLIVPLVPKVGSLSLAPVYSYNIFRLLTSLVLLLALFFFVSFFVKENTKRLFIFLFISLSGGLGWLEFFKSSFPVDLGTKSWANLLPEANTFWSMESHPHLTFSQALMVVVFLFLLKYQKTKNLFYPLWAGILAIFLFLIHPFDFPIVYLVPLVFYALRPQKKGAVFHLSLEMLKPLLIMFSLSFPAVVYYVFLVKTDPAFQAWSTVANITPSPLKLFPVFGFLVPLAFLGIYQLIRQRKKDVWYFLPIWIGVCSFLLYFPNPFQRKLIEGVHVPLSFLAASGVWETIPKLSNKLRFFILATVLVLCSFSAPFYVYRDIFWLEFKTKRNFLPEEVLFSLGWLHNHSHYKETVLGPSSEISFAIPAFSGNQIFYGHWFKPKIDALKGRLMNSFFTEDRREYPSNVSFLNTGNAMDFLNYWGIKIVFLDKEQFPYFDDYYPKEVPYLKKQFENEKVAIYKTLL